MENKCKPDKLNKDSRKPRDQGRFITCFTDASTCPDTGAWGIAIWIKAQHDKKPELVIKGGIANDNAKPFDYELKALTTMRSHLLQNYDLKNKIIVIQSGCIGALDKISIKKLINAGASFVKKKHVKAHTNNKTNRTKVNRIVDTEARKEMKRQREGKDAKS